MIKIRKFKAGDAKDASDLIIRTYKKFNSCEDSRSAARAYLDFHDHRPALFRRGDSSAVEKIL